jgi:hypothetical protein
MFRMKSEVVGHLQWVSDLVQNVDQNICERRRLPISEISCEFPQISGIVLYEIISQTRLSYVWRKMGSANSQNVGNGFGSDFF